MMGICFETLLLEDGHLKSSLQSTEGRSSFSYNFIFKCGAFCKKAVACFCFQRLLSVSAVGEAAAVTRHTDFFLCRLLNLRKVICIAEYVADASFKCGAVRFSPVLLYILYEDAQECCWVSQWLKMKFFKLG